AFCDEFARNAFLKALNDVVLAAGGNVDRANAYLGDLNAEFAKANADKVPTAVVIAIKQEIDAYAAVGKAQREVYDRLEAVYRDARVKPLDKNCPKAADGSGGGAPAINDGPKSVNQPKAPTDGPTVGCACEDRRPIEVGSNSRVGSGAR